MNNTNNNNNDNNNNNNHNNNNNNNKAQKLPIFILEEMTCKLSMHFSLTI